MTTSQPDALPALSSELIPGTNAEGCTCVVASYTGAASLLSAATEDASRRIMMTPALGDFIDLCFVNIGPDPASAGDPSAAVRLITDAVLAAGSDAGHSDFAIIVADRSAAVAEGVLTHCARSPFLARLPMRLHGIAAVDDLRLARDFAGAQITVAGPGAWTHEFLVNELRRYADELMRYFAAARGGITQTELDSLRATYEQHVVRENGGKTLVLPGAVAQAAPQPQPQSGPSEQIVPAAPGLAPAAPDSAEAPSSPAVDCGPSLPGPADSEPTLPGPADSEPTPGRLHRFRNVWPRRGNPSVPIATAAMSVPRVTGLAYFILIGDTLADDPDAWQHSRSTLLEVDQKIAALQEIAYDIRLLEGDEHGLRGELRRAGQLSRRDVKRPISDADFSEVLEEIQTMARRDAARSVGSGKLLTPPAVLFFVSEPPLADSVAAEVFGEFAREALIIWVIPKDMKDLMAPDFADPPSACVVENGFGAADDIAGLLAATASLALQHEQE